MVAPNASSPITSFTGSAGDPIIDAMLTTVEALRAPVADRASIVGMTGAKWGGPIGSGEILTYSFISPGSPFASNYSAHRNGVQQVPEELKAAARDALGEWSKVANIVFVEVPESAGDVGDLRIGVTTSNPNFAPGAPGAEASPPVVGLSNPERVGDLWINPHPSWTYGKGDLGYTTLLHEFGHAAIGLTDVSTNLGMLRAKLPADLNYRTTTVMSYWSLPGSSVGESPTQGQLSKFPTTPMTIDILAAQYLYGANNSYRTGDDVYLFDAQTPYHQTIWDAAGTDTLSVAGSAKAASLNLTPGSYSNVGAAVTVQMPNGLAPIVGVGIAYGAIIENAVGGLGNDAILGNDAANVLTGGKGDDTINGGGGVDAAIFSGNSSGYSVARQGADLIVVGKDGADIVRNVEYLRFDDVVVDAVRTQGFAVVDAKVFSAPTVAITAFVTGKAPTTTEFAARIAFSETQYAYYAHTLGVASPQLGPYEALGLAFSDTAAFSVKYSASETKEAFVARAYKDAFARDATSAQSAALIQQIDYFASLYRGAGVSVDIAQTHARGAVFGQIVGYMMDERATAFSGKVNSFLAGVASGTAPFGDPWV